MLTNHYRTPHLFSRWATGLARREALGSTGIARGFGLLHQFQDDGAVRLNTPPGDWWRVLLPEGGEWRALDGEPVYGMLGHVFPPDHGYMPGLKLRTWEWTCRAARRFDSERWAEIARLDRVATAQTLNREILMTMEDRARKYPGTGSSLRNINENCRTQTARRVERYLASSERR